MKGSSVETRKTVRQLLWLPRREVWKPEHNGKKKRQSNRHSRKWKLPWCCPPSAHWTEKCVCPCWAASWSNWYHRLRVMSTLLLRPHQQNLWDCAKPILYHTRVLRLSSKTSKIAWNQRGLQVKYSWLLSKHPSTFGSNAMGQALRQLAFLGSF